MLRSLFPFLSLSNERRGRMYSKHLKRNDSQPRERERKRETRPWVSRSFSKVDACARHVDSFYGKSGAIEWGAVTAGDRPDCLVDLLASVEWEAVAVVVPKTRILHALSLFCAWRPFHCVLPAPHAARVAKNENVSRIDILARSDTTDNAFLCAEFRRRRRSR